MIAALKIVVQPNAPDQPRELYWSPLAQSQFTVKKRCLRA